MGYSNPHPHSQIWAQSQLPNGIIKELTSQVAYFREHRQLPLLDYLAEEHKRGEQSVFQNVHFTELVPFWAVWPFEILLIAHRPSAKSIELTSIEITALAEVLRQIPIRFDNYLKHPFLIRRDFTKPRSMSSRIPNRHCMRIFIRRY